MSKRYGTEWRPWPHDYYWDDAGQRHRFAVGYFGDYRREFAAMFDKVEYPSPWGADRNPLTLYLCAFAPGQDEATWWWSVVSFSWTPDGHYLDRYVSGQHPTRGRAEAACREAADNWVARIARSYGREKAH